MKILGFQQLIFSVPNLPDCQGLGLPSQVLGISQGCCNGPSDDAPLLLVALDLVFDGVEGFLKAIQLMGRPFLNEPPEGAQVLRNDSKRGVGILSTDLIKNQLSGPSFHSAMRYCSGLPKPLHPFGR